MAERGWDAVTFEGVRRAQLREQMRLTPEERLRWLEEALKFAAEAERSRDRRRARATGRPPSIGVD
jgi:hypothetical protein